MIRSSWLRMISVCLAIACAVTVSGTAGVVAHQRDAITPAAQDEWVELGIEFATSGQDSGTSMITGDTYVLPSSGAEVVIGQGVTADDPAESDFADQIIVSIPVGLGAVAVIEGPGFPLAVMEVYVGAFGESMDAVVEVDIQSDQNYATGLYRMHSGNDVVYFFISIDTVVSPGNNSIQVVVTERDEVADSIVLLRENVLVDGVPMFANVDEPAIQALVDQDEMD